MELSVKARIEALRHWMGKHGLDALIIPTSDPHQSEYVADHWNIREWISGFTGSAGTVVITNDHAGLWTDSRYFLQAEKELEPAGMVLHKLVNQGAAEYVDWLAEELMKGQRVGIDGKLFAVSEVRSIERIFTRESILLDIIEDPFDTIWEDRPGLPLHEIFEVSPLITGTPRKERIQSVFREIQNKGCSVFLLTALDEIAWLLNLRGRDVACNPVFIAYALMEDGLVKLFTDPVKISEEIKKSLLDDGVTILPYHLIEDYLRNLDVDKTILIDIHKTNISLYESLGTPRIFETSSPVTIMKACKNTIEQKHLKKAMVKDGVALVKAYIWLENQLSGGVTVTEAQFADEIARQRSLQPGYFGESFNAIIGSGPNGAIVHYRPRHGSSAFINKDQMLLVDSGGQYEDGTTDITRTHHFGQPTEEEKRYYTLVLKGHIALAAAVFPKGTKGVQLDTLARQYLWQNMANYGHGTGHGVGFFMNVHEPPQGFTPGLGERGVTAHLPGMYTSNEPGFYKEGHFGIRIENLVLCTVAGQSDFGAFYKLDTITLFPIDTNLIDKTILNESERHWLNDYHLNVLSNLSPDLDEAEKTWLEAKCRAI